MGFGHIILNSLSDQYIPYPSLTTVLLSLTTIELYLLITIMRCYKSDENTMLYKQTNTNNTNSNGNNNNNNNDHNANTHNNVSKNVINVTAVIVTWSQVYSECMKLINKLQKNITSNGFIISEHRVLMALNTLYTYKLIGIVNTSCMIKNKLGNELELRRNLSKYVMDNTIIYLYIPVFVLQHEFISNNIYNEYGDRIICNTLYDIATICSNTNNTNSNNNKRQRLQIPDDLRNIVLNPHLNI